MWASLWASAGAAQQPEALTLAIPPPTAVARFFLKDNGGLYRPAGVGVFLKPSVVAAAGAANATAELYVRVPGGARLLRAVARPPADPRVASYDVVGVAVDVPKTAPFPAPGAAVAAFRPTLARGLVPFAGQVAAPGAAERGTAGLAELSFGERGSSVAGPVFDDRGRLVGLITSHGSADGRTLTALPVGDVLAALESKNPLAPAPQAAAPGSVPRAVGIQSTSSDAETPADKPVTSVQLLNQPRPNFTDAARLNKTQGNVLVKVLFGKDGRVKQAKVVRGLADGLNEMAIKAVYQFKFRPAVNAAGNPVDQWKTVNVAFTLRFHKSEGEWIVGGAAPGGMRQLSLASENDRIGGIAYVEGPDGPLALDVSATAIGDAEVTLQSAPLPNGDTLSWQLKITDEAMSGTQSTTARSGQDHGRTPVRLTRPGVNVQRR